MERKNLVNNGMILQRTMQAGKRATMNKDEMPKVRDNIYKGPAQASNLIKSVRSNFSSSPRDEGVQFNNQDHFRFAS